MSWKPQIQMTPETFSNWQNKKVVLPRVKESATDMEKDQLVEIDGLGEVRWGIEMGRPYDAHVFFAGVFEERKPLVIQIYPKPHTAMMRALNVSNHRLVGTTIANAIVDRYEPHAVKVEYFDPNDMRERLDIHFEHALCVVIREGAWTRGEKYREETLKAIEDALLGLEN